jgi:glycosyltransferase involved in cell wall biosynthesis
VVSDATMANRTASRIRVLVLLNSLAPYGAENFVLNHARFADRDRFEIVVAHLGGTRDLAARFAELGVETIDLAAGGRRRFTLGMIRRLAGVLQDRRIDILQTHIRLAGVVGTLVGRLARVPVVVVTEQTTLSSHPGWVQRASMLAFPFAHQHVYISRAVADDFARRFSQAAGPEVTIITNGIDTGAIARTARSARAEVRAELGLGPRDVAFANVGRLADQKGQRYAISALAEVRVRHPESSLWIIGEGDLREPLSRHAADEGVASAVHFLGQRMDVHRLLGGFDAYVHPALFEGLGIAPLEAMAAGLPVIASSVDAIPEYVHDGETGVLVPPRDVDALARAMTGVLDEPTVAARLATAGQRLVEHEHDIRAAVRAYEALYERLLARARITRAA